VFRIVTLHNYSDKLPETGTMRHLPLLFILIMLSPGAHAEKGQSIMFGDPDPISSQTGRDTAEQEKTDLCKQLRHEMDALKGKPQRRNAVVQRYRLECQPHGSP
jgi:hypothetical protein